MSDVTVVVTDPVVLELMSMHNTESFKGEHTNLEVRQCVCSAFVGDDRPVVARPPGVSGLQDGGLCFKCGGMTVRTGTCTTCTTCGESGGCG